MSVKNAVLGIVIVASAARAGADIPDGKGGRTAPQASPRREMQHVRECCKKTTADDCGALATRKEQATIEPRVPPQRAVANREPALRRGCCEGSTRCDHIS